MPYQEPKTDSIIPSSMGFMKNALSDAKNLREVSEILVRYNASQPYDNIHIGICKLDDAPVKDILHSCPIPGLGLSVSDFSEELKWGVCTEGEYQLRPFDLLTHEFKTMDTHKFDDLRERVARSGVKQIMIIPMKIQNTTTIAIINFPQADFEKHAGEVLPQFYQLMLTLFERFPKLLSWSKASKLTPREAEVLSLSASGLTESVIASKCGISVNTVRNHVENSKAKLNARNKLHAVMLAADNHELNRNSEPRTS